MKKIVTASKVSVIIPAYNEADIIDKTLKNLSFDWINEIIVVNDGSRDDTRNYIKKYPVKLIDFKKNKGKGKDVEKALKQVEGDIIVLIDADLGCSVKEIKKLVKPIINGKADITIANIPVKKGGVGLVRTLADRGLQYISGHKMRAPLSGQRAFRCQLIDTVLPLSSGFGLEIGMDLDLINSKYQVREIDCDFKHKTTGHSIKGYLHRGRQFLAILKTLWKKRGLR